IVFGTLHFGGSPVGELVLETRFSRIPREPPPSTFNYARDIAAFQAPALGRMLQSKAGKTLKMGSLQRPSKRLKIPLDTPIKSANNQAGTFFNLPVGETKEAEVSL
ncbi:hypothetical protein, partial [Burkholderia cenocepacia]